MSPTDQVLAVIGTNDLEALSCKGIANVAGIPFASACGVVGYLRSRGRLVKLSLKFTTPTSGWTRGPWGRWSPSPAIGQGKWNTYYLKD